MGAAIAAGSQAEKGIWALLVIAAIIIEIIINIDIEVYCIFIIFQCPWFKDQLILNKIITSPIRFDRAVIIAAPQEVAP